VTSSSSNANNNANSNANSINVGIDGDVDDARAQQDRRLKDLQSWRWLSR
jgi:hypothetical protein